MIQPHDRIARPAQGRFFAVSVAETVKLIQHLGFVTPTDRERLNITFRNPKHSTDHGINVAAFYPADEIIVYSFPDDMDRSQAESLLERAFHELARLAKHDPPNVRRRIPAVSLWAYFQAPDCLTITRKEWHITRAKYRSGMKISNAFKPKGIKTDERVLCKLSVT